MWPIGGHTHVMNGNGDQTMQKGYVCATCMFHCMLPIE
jgi:hypothetical protein